MNNENKKINEVSTPPSTLEEKLKDLCLKLEQIIERLPSCSPSRDAYQGVLASLKHTLRGDKPDTFFLRHCKEHNPIPKVEREGGTPDGEGEDKSFQVDDVDRMGQLSA
jgi:hypothetical protein